MQKFMLVARPVVCNENTSVMLDGRSYNDFVAVLAEETETSVCRFRLVRHFLGERSNLEPTSSSFSSLSTWCHLLLIFRSSAKPVVFSLLTK